jgi:hypothetical protein
MCLVSVLAPELDDCLRATRLAGVLCLFRVENAVCGDIFAG